jgi:zinc protease
VQSLAKNIDQYTLDNGLEVILKPVETSSAVTVWVFYNVGSRNEAPGITGISHFCEHMLFKGGGKLHTGDIFKLVSTEGGMNNGFTDTDLTAYYEILPKEKLDVGLFIESERMANSAFEPSAVESERSVVISEREGSENYPQYLMREEMFASAFRIHPYRWPVVGWKSDLRRITREELYSHYRRFYHPRNALLLISGNYESGPLKRKVEQYFSQIPAGDKAPKDLGFIEPPQLGPRTSKIEYNGGALQYLIAGFRVPEASHADIPALMVLSSIFAGWDGLIGFFGNRSGFVSRSNRMYKKLVEGKIASDVSFDFPLTIDPSLLYFQMTILNERSTAEALRALDELLIEAWDLAPSESEMRVALNQIRAWHAYENESVAGKALTLGVSQILHSAGLADSLVEKALKVSPDEVRSAARKYLTESNRTICSVEPTRQKGM